MEEETNQSQFQLFGVNVNPELTVAKSRDLGLKFSSQIAAFFFFFYHFCSLLPLPPWNREVLS